MLQFIVEIIMGLAILSVAVLYCALVFLIVMMSIRYFKSENEDLFNWRAKRLIRRAIRKAEKG